MQESGDLGLIHRASGKGILLGNAAPGKKPEFWVERRGCWMADRAASGPQMANCGFSDVYKGLRVFLGGSFFASSTKSGRFGHRCLIQLAVASRFQVNR